MAGFEVITGPERRRRWSVEHKRAIVAKSLARGAVVMEIARRADAAQGKSIAGGGRSASAMVSPRF